MPQSVKKNHLTNSIYDILLLILYQFDGILIKDELYVNQRSTTG